ncbi:MAG TPA: hypothetical protein VIV60_22880, partial [Polyangiaceae bacterium]
MRRVSSVAFTLLIASAASTGCLGGSDQIPGSGGSSGEHAKGGAGGSASGGVGNAGGVTAGGISGASAAAGTSQAQALSNLERWGIADDAPVGLVGRALL